jgi:ABC-type sugar transport system substrate-binding protein
MSMKRSTPRHLTGAAVALVLALGLSACSSSGQANKSSSSHKVNVAFVYATTTLNPMQEMAFGSTAAAAAQGVNLTSNAPSGNDGAAEVQLFQSAARNATAGISYETLTPDLFIRPLKTATAAHTPVVAVDTPPPAGSGVDLYVGSSDFAIGEALATKMLDKIPANATGEIVIGNAIPGLIVLDLRAKGMTAVFKAKRPGLKVVGPLGTAPEPTANFAAWDSIVKAHPNAVAYLGTGAQDVVSLATIAKKRGAKLLIGGVDLDPASLEALQAGVVYALVSPEHWLKGYIAMSLLAAQAKGGAQMPKGWWDSGFLVFDPSNVAAIAARQNDAASRLAWFQKVAAEQLANPGKHLRPLSDLG